jgi:small-conductance mechanosensitive channel
MNTRRVYSIVLCLLLLPAVLSSFGCAKKTGIDMAEKVTTSMQTVQNDYQLTAAQIDATNGSLNNLINAAQTPDMKSSFETFSTNVEKMNTMGKDLNKHTDQMLAQGNDYFLEWHQEGDVYTNPNIQKLSEQRRVHLRQTFNKIPAASAGVQGSLNNYIARLNQIETYLSNDLTPKGVSAISSIAQTTMQDGNNLKESFKPVQTAINEARTEMMPGGSAAGGVAPSESGVASGGTGTAGEAGVMDQNLGGPGSSGTVVP